MSDEDIKKALECCVSTDDCKKCPLGGTHQCYPTLENNALDLIYRQQAEIEQLKSLCTLNDVIIKAQEAEIKQAKSEAIKEFAERLESKYTKVDICNAGYVYETIKKVKKEMAGEQNA